MNIHKIIFPLCLLNFPKEIKEKYNLIISYGVINYAYKILNNSYDEPSMESIKDYVLENELLDFNENEILDYHIVYACMLTGLVIKDLNKAMIDYCKVKSYVDDFEKKYKKDSLVKVGSDLLKEVRDEKFPDRLFRCYCAIKSILGKGNLCRITNNTISVRMKGFKTQNIMNSETVNINESLTDRQIKSLTLKLKKLKFIERYTYNMRCTYYSIKFRGDKFNEVFSNYMSSRKAKQGIDKIQNDLIQNAIDEKCKNKLDRLREKKTINCKIFDISDLNTATEIQEVKYGER